MFQLINQNFVTARVECYFAVQNSTLFMVVFSLIDSVNASDVELFGLSPY